ncbi:MAG: hypothetical protein LBF81_00675 [Prevotellaceae bacterium]|jgi:hypothetical protein|nr:hypothetical protein [Prevotellaceae bacterium]
MKARLLFFFFFLFTTLNALAQEPVTQKETGDVKGKVVARTTRQPVDGAKITINTPQNIVVYTTEGTFELNDIPAGQWEISIEAADYMPVRLPVKVTKSATTEIQLVTLAPDITPVADFAIDEFDSDIDDAGQDLPVTLSATQDVFESIANYKFGILRFRNRGYDNNTAKVYMNGIYLNDAQSGYSPWSLWGGLNDAVRNQENSSALAVSDYGVGSINGVTQINATASQIRKGLRMSAVNASGQYLFRGMITYASGENENGWSYAFSGSTRQGGNFWVKGVDYNAWAYFGSVEKRLNRNSRLALTFFGSPAILSTQAAATQEAFDLVNSNYYNPNWGYQNGEVRNARVRNNHEPVLLLNYSLDINPKNKLHIGLSYRFGRNGYSALNWYDAQDPRPDYYRYLPSYFGDAATPANQDMEKAAWLTESWKSDWNTRQINWDALYDVNRRSFYDPADGVLPGLSLINRRSKYIVEERRTDQQDVNFKIQLLSILSDRLNFSGGLDYRWNQTEYFKVIKDLLGGDYWLDIDQFAERDFGDSQIIQNDLNHPNRVVYKGDKYGYDYYSRLQSERLWTILKYNVGQWETYGALEGGHTNFWRDGQYRKGLFPDNSYGKSAPQDFWTYSAKIGATFKLSGSHRLWANLAYITEAPYFQRAMVSPRTRNDFIPGLTTEKTASADLNYALQLPWIKLRVSGYYTTIKDQVDVISFYDDLNRTFSNFAMRDIDQMHTGLEAGVEVPLLFNITLKGALSYGYYIYTSDPNVTITADNGSRLIYDNMENTTIYWKNYKISGTPQTALNIGLDYRSPKNLFLGVDLGYYAANYISMNPLRRTDASIKGLNEDQIRATTRQEMFPDAFILNANIGKIWYIGKYMIGVNLDMRNILNNTHIKSGGYEQMRLTRDNSNPDNITYSPFDSKYYYLLGTTYYLNVYFRF